MHNQVKKLKDKPHRIHLQRHEEFQMCYCSITLLWMVLFISAGRCGSIQTEATCDSDQIRIRLKDTDDQRLSLCVCLP